nr:AMIN domain-containing protein [Nitrospirales bacterium]
MKRFLRGSALLLAVLHPSIGWTASFDESIKATQHPSPPPSIARTLTRVDLQQRAGKASVLLSADGQLSYRIRSLNTDRVIVDLLNVATKLSHAFEFNDPIVKQIRIGQHPNTLRLVIDLRQTAIYSVQEGKNTLSVVLTPRVGSKQPLSAVSAEPSPDLPGSSSAVNPVSPAGRTLGQEQVDYSRPSDLEANRAITDPRPRQDVRNRAADRRVVDQSTNQSATERYVAAFGGFSLSQSFTNVHGAGANASVNVSDLALARTGIGGLKLGFSPSTAKWMALETEVFYASPHFKEQNVTVTGNSGTVSSDFSGSRARVATWAFNWIVRYPGEWIQPYAGAGLGIFWGRLADSGGTSSSDTSPGLNALAGLRIKLGQHFMLFSEYKYNRTSFDFSNSDFHVLYQAHYVVGGLGWSF